MDDSLKAFLPPRKSIHHRPGTARIGTLVLTGCIAFSCAGRGEPAYVLAANFYPSPIDLRIGEEPAPVFAVAALPPGEISGLEEARGSGDVPVAYRLAGREAWQRPLRALSAAPCRIRPGMVTAVIIDSRGFVRAAALAEDARPGARLSFLNATGVRLPSLRVGLPGEKSFPVFWANGLRPGRATRFSSVVPGSYRLSVRLASPPPAALKAAGPDPALTADLECAESDYWLLYCYVKDGAYALGKRRLAIQENNRLTPSPSGLP